MLDDVLRQLRVLVGAAQARGERHARLQALAVLLGDTGQHRGVDDAGGDGVHPDAELRQVAGGRDGHARHAALGRRIGDLADLALEGRHRRGVDDDAALAVLVDRLGLGDGVGGQPHHVEGAEQVHGDDRAEQLQIVRAVLGQDPTGPADAGAVHDDARRHAGLDDRGDGGGHLVAAGDIGRNQGDARRHAVAGALDGLLQVQPEYGGPQVGEARGGRGAQAGRSSGDDCGGSRNLHGVLVLSFVTALAGLPSTSTITGVPGDSAGGRRRTVCEQGCSPVLPSSVCQSRPAPFVSCPAAVTACPGRRWSRRSATAS